MSEELKSPNRYDRRLQAMVSVAIAYFLKHIKDPYQLKVATFTKNSPLHFQLSFFRLLWLDSRELLVVAVSRSAIYSETILKVVNIAFLSEISFNFKAFDSDSVEFKMTVCFDSWQARWNYTIFEFFYR